MLNLFKKLKILQEMSKKRKIFCYNTLVITYLSDLFKLHGYSQLAVESLLPSPENYSIDEHYFSSLSKPYKVIDENGVILSLPTNLRQVLARYFAHNGITRLRSFSIDKTYFQSTNTSAYSSHPETRTEFCLDILRPKSSATDSTAIEILQMVIEICHKLRPLSQNKWQIIINHTALVKAIALHFSINDQQKLCGFFNLLYDFSSRLKSKIKISKLYAKVFRSRIQFTRIRIRQKL
jgi:histidyl-tRNA synthetase